ncbi:MAG: DUF3592 domain-containing protein [Chlorobiales bacterium]|nr:DUF3592 domain-containing protein [Chlorobiales bacterium]
MLQLSPKIRFLIVRGFPIPFILMGIVITYMGVRTLYYGSESESWPITTGRIKSSNMDYTAAPKREQQERSGSYHAEILYQFKVQGKIYSGDRIAFGGYGETGEEYVQKLLNRFPEGKLVRVYYKADDPEVCALQPGQKSEAWYIPIVGLAFVLFGTLAAVFLPKLLQDKNIIAK